MCTSNKHSLPIFRPIRKHHQGFLEELFPKVPATFIEEFLEIACYGMNTEIVTAISLLTPIQHIYTGEISMVDDWRKGGSGVLFSTLPKVKGPKLQTQNMRFLHDHVIPWLATENMHEHTAQLLKIGITPVFMHSCGDERFPTPLWEDESDRRAQMFDEQATRTELDWTHGVKMVGDKYILKHGIITKRQLATVNFIIEASERAHHVSYDRVVHV